jgi:quercetin dioxygenase-like cupin family protein
MKGAVAVPGAISLCPIPHSAREKFWLLFGVAAGAALTYAYAARAARASTASAGARPRVLPAPARVVDVPGVLRIDEHVGNAANGEAGVSVARVVVAAASGEPTQRPLFDEYVVVLRGEMRVAVGGGEALVASAGQTIHLPRGFTYTATFPGDAEYIAVCLPAFAPALAVRQ